MISNKNRLIRFFLTLTLVLFFPSFNTFAREDMHGTAFVINMPMTIGLTIYGILALLLAFLTIRFFIGALKNSNWVKIIGVHVETSAPTPGKRSLDNAYSLGNLSAVLVVGILFLNFFYALIGVDFSSVRYLRPAILSVGLFGCALFFLYIIFFLAPVLMKDTPKPVEKALPEAGEQNFPGIPLNPAITRRSFLSLLGWAWLAFVAATLGALTTVARFFFPNVTFEPFSKFKAGFPDSYALGVDERFKNFHQVWMVRERDKFYALSTICTHLGCTPNWLQTERKFKCPCHGSGFYVSGINFEGPAPRPLERFQITLAEDGQIEVDKSIKYQYELGQWGLPGSFLEYKS